MWCSLIIVQLATVVSSFLSKSGTRHQVLPDIIGVNYSEYRLGSLSEREYQLVSAQWSKKHEISKKLVFVTIIDSVQKSGPIL